MNVRDLKELLSNYTDDTEVMLAQPTYNHWNMVKAVAINDHSVTLGVVKENAYLEGEQVIDEDEEDFDEFSSLSEGQRQVLLIG